MKLGVSIRLMGEASTRNTIRACAISAEEAGLDELWVPDHIAIPPDDAEGSNGRYLDPLASLAWLAACTSRIGLGTGVLVLPYRPPLPTAKWIATIQELSEGRVRLGVGVGWMQAEFDALGLNRRQRGRLTDMHLDLIRRCFSAEDDVVTENGQPFLFRPHPPTPPIFIGGHGEHALERTIRFGDGWMPMTTDPGQLAPEIAKLRQKAESAERSMPEVVCLGNLADEDAARGAARLHALSEIGVTRVLTGGRYQTHSEFERIIEGVVAVQEAAGSTETTP